MCKRNSDVRSFEFCCFTNSPYCRTFRKDAPSVDEKPLPLDSTLPTLPTQHTKNDLRFRELRRAFRTTDIGQSRGAGSADCLFHNLNVQSIPIPLYKALQRGFHVARPSFHDVAAMLRTTGILYVSDPLTGVALGKASDQLCCFPQTLPKRGKLRLARDCATWRNLLISTRSGSCRA